MRNATSFALYGSLNITQEQSLKLQDASKVKIHQSDFLTALQDVRIRLRFVQCTRLVWLLIRPAFVVSSWLRSFSHFLSRPLSMSCLSLALFSACQGDPPAFGMNEEEIKTLIAGELIPYGKDFEVRGAD